MKLTRRSFLGTVTGVGVAAAGFVDTNSAKPGIPPAGVRSGSSYDPWISVDREALAFNVHQLSELGGGKPVMAVVKNNAYGLGLEQTVRMLEPHPEITGFAVVKAAECFRLMEAGIHKPIMLLARAAEEEEIELARAGATLSLFSEDDAKRLERLAAKIEKPVKVHFYVDTGMSRVGMPYYKAVPWMREVASLPSVTIVSTFTDFTEEPDFDREQLDRFRSVLSEASGKGIPTGIRHAASSNGVYHFPESRLDMIRPGIALYGAYPTSFEEEKQTKELRVAYRLQARIARVEHLRKGDSVSYGRKFIAEEPTWIATLPVGHSDGYPRNAVKGAKILINGGVYPVIGAVSASHCIVNLGDEQRAKAGDVATLVGPDHPAIHPNAIAQVTGVSVYDILMHMNSLIPKVIS